jgi:uridine kinase
VLTHIWEQVPKSERPLLLAVDGPDGAGKTVFAAALVEAAPDRSAIAASVDDFHFPRAHRHAEGRTGQTVWDRSFDYRAVRRELVDPWRRGPGSSYRRRWHDLATDAYVDEPREQVPSGGVLVFEGVFGQRPELASAWDLVVYVDAPVSVRMARMALRDGVPRDPDDPAQKRYLDAQRIYHERCRPLESADVVVDNSDPASPRFV